MHGKHFSTPVRAAGSPLTCAVRAQTLLRAAAFDVRVAGRVVRDVVAIPRRLAGRWRRRVGDSVANDCAHHETTDGPQRFVVVAIVVVVAVVIGLIAAAVIDWATVVIRRVAAIVVMTRVPHVVGIAPARVVLVATTVGPRAGMTAVARPARRRQLPRLPGRPWLHTRPR